jgi:lon-related putative ATP-dependent protease
VRTATGIAIAPLRGDTVIDAAEFQRLPEAEQAERKAAMEDAGREVMALFREFHDRVRQHHDALEALDRDIAASVARRVIDTVRGAHRGLAAVLAYLDEVERDVVEHVDRFVTGDDEDGVPAAIRRALDRGEGEDARFRRYEINVMVDRGASRGAPVVYEDNPTHANLIGRIDHRPELGALVTDVTLIRPGALHRANGGYLLLDAAAVLQQPFAWEALKRALRTREIRIEPLGLALGLVSTVSLEPEPIPLDTKVVLLGDRRLYYLLAALDPDVAELFKVMADFEEDVDRRRETEASYARLVAGLVAAERLRAFDRGAIARVIEQAARLAGDAQKLSVRLRGVVDLLREADHVAGQGGRATVAADDVQRAIDAQLRRGARMRERILEAIRRAMLLVDTTGERVGQVNGLSVVDLGAGAQAFAHPTRITARARVGRGDVIDLEREVELGGPIHSKGVLILTGLLGARYAARTPLSLSASIVLEQSYGGVEGDSASLAELCALLSAIAEVPIRQGLAITGSIDQHGVVQPIGGVNEKIEGFFDVCRERGLTGDQGVLIPRKDVVAAVAERRFHVHAVRDVDEAITLVTGRSAGARDGSGAFPAGSVNALVEARLATFAEDARRFLVRAPPA